MNLEDLPPLRDVIAAHDLRPQKALGQNFLLDQNITDKIVRLAAERFSGVPAVDGVGDLSGMNLIEVGPGPGGLTRSLLRAGAQSVHAVELDSRAVAALQDLRNVSDGRLEIIEGDACGMDLPALVPAPRMIVANLPYNVASVLLVGWLRDLFVDFNAYSGMALMFQKEVAQRITAKVGDKHYGRLAVLCQWLCDVQIVYDLPASAFTPPPKVKSAIVYFKPRAPRDDWPVFEAVEAVTAAAFGQRRKMIRSSLKDYSDALAALGIDPTLRAENLSGDVFLRIALYGKNGAV